MCQDRHLTLRWEKYHFVVNKRMVIGHIMFSEGIEVDQAKLNFIGNLSLLTCVKGIRPFLGHVRFYRRFSKVA